MPAFTNRATLSYNGNTTNSNTITGNLVEVLSAAKTAVRNEYSSGDSITYVVSITNAGTTPYTNLTLTDNLGEYAYGESSLVPLTYLEGSIRYFINGTLTADPAVTAGPPLEITGIQVPAQGNAVLIYEARANEFAPPELEGSITNTAVISGGGLNTPLTASAVVNAETRANLTISKAVCPAVVTENGQLTYTFIIQNSGNTPAAADDNVVLTDTFNPVLNSITVTYNGEPWDASNYTYNTETGEFSTVPGQITVPAAGYIRQEDGTWTIDPGVSTLVITGTV